jgi:A/G-specific adenine glycosylase
MMVATPPHVAALQQVLRPWMDAVRRDLPWRRTRDPWAILVAEVMLQQTQVARVVPKWEAFLRMFPTPAACAEAAQADIVRAWEGLGYHRRALTLHGSAIAITEDHGGVVPRELDTLLRLAGVGPYTARAIRTFAYEYDDAVLDTNVARIVARAVAGERCTATRAQSLADALVPPGDGWAWNQGMLDLGAAICTARAPRCDACPIAELCCWQTERGTKGDAPDPSIGSAGVSGRQSRFEGSDRQGRGRILGALRKGPVSSAQLGAITQWSDDERIRRVLQGLVNDRLVRLEDSTVFLR